LQPEILLHPDDIANAAIFDLPQHGSGYFAIVPALASLQKFLRA
jgi:hypothetical protein